MSPINGYTEIIADSNNDMKVIANHAHEVYLFYFTFAHLRNVRNTLNVSITTRIVEL